MVRDEGAVGREGGELEAGVANRAEMTAGEHNLLSGVRAGVAPELIAQDTGRESVVGAHDVGGAVVGVLGSVGVSSGKDIFDAKAEGGDLGAERSVVELVAEVDAKNRGLNVEATRGEGELGELRDGVVLAREQSRRQGADG